MSTFTVGGLVGRTFRVWWQNLGVFSMLAALVYLPVMLAAFAMGLGSMYTRSPLEPADPAMFTSQLGRVGILYVFILMVFAVHMAALTYGAIQSLGERPVRLGELLAVGVRRALPVIVASIVAYVLFVLGFLLLIVPGLILITAMVVTVPTIVVERAGPFKAIGRSFRLTKGRRLALFAAFFVFFLVLMAVGMVGAVAFPVASAFLGSGAAVVGLVLTLVVNVVFASLPTIAPAVAYHDLRAEKEGVGTAELAKVFE
jgi:hypothetical protein